MFQLASIYGHVSFVVKAHEQAEKVLNGLDVTTIAPNIVTQNFKQTVKAPITLLCILICANNTRW